MQREEEHISICFMYSAYFDESGTHGSSVAVVVSGIIASDEQWLTFSNDWKATLLDFGVSRFHMRDFAHSLREFSAWKGDETPRSQFLRQLVQVIRKNTRHSFSTAVITADYNDVNGRYLLSEYASPYCISALQCVVDAAKWRNAREYTSPVNLVFADGVKDKGQFMRFYAPDNFDPVRYEKATESAAFEAADFVAWEHRKVLDQMLSKGLKRYRQSYGALFSMPNNWGVYEHTMLLKWCKTVGVPERSARP